MKTEVKKLDSTKREVNIAVNGEIVKNKFDEVFKKVGQEAKVPGFRPGHAPRQILEKHFSSEIERRVIEELIPDVYAQAVREERLEAVDLPSISEVKLERGSNNLSFKATVEVRPEIKLGNYKGIRVNYKKIEAPPDEIKRHMDALKESAKIDTLDDRFARGLGYPGLSELEEAVEKQILIQKDNAQRNKVENEIIGTITKDLDFKLPQSLVNRQLEDLVKQAKIDLALKGMPREEIDSREKTLFSELEPEAKRQIKVYLVLSEIAKKENISLDDQMSHRVMEFLLREADWQETN